MLGFQRFNLLLMHFVNCPTADLLSSPASTVKMCSPVSISYQVPVPKDLFYFSGKSKICKFLYEKEQFVTFQYEKVTICHFSMQKSNDLSLLQTIK